MDYAALLAFLQSLNEPTAVDSDEIGLYLQSFKHGFLKLLDFKGSSTESRRQVQQDRKVTTAKHGEVQLDPEPDVKQALLFSDEIRLDEVLCVEYLLSAWDERGIFGAEYGAGLYLEERQQTLRCLARLLAVDARLQHGHHYAGGPMAQRPLTATAIASFVSELLGEKDPSGKQILVSRLVTILRDTSLEPRPNTPLPVVRDEAGNPVPRTVLLQKERREAARCLLYCCTRDPHVAPAVAAELLELLTGLLSRLGGTGSGDLFLVEECQLVLLACCSVLVPHEGRNFQRAALQELAQATRAKVVESSIPSPAVSQAGYSANLRLCWGLLAICSQGAPQDGVAAVRDALKVGAFSFLRQIFNHPHFKLDDQTHHHVVAAAVHHMVHTLLRTDGERTSNTFFVQLLQRSEAAIRPISQGGHAVLSYVAFPPEAPECRSDHLGTLLGVLADCFDVFPELYLANLADQDAGQRPIREFLDRTINNNIMKMSPEVRVPFLQLMAALASSERGVHLVLRQMDAMAQVPALEVLTLRKLFQTVLSYCLRFFATASDVERTQGTQLAQSANPSQYDWLINPFEADILVAFLKLLRRVLEYGRTAEVVAFWTSTSAELAPSLNGFPLHEPLFVLMCFPVQNTVKAALDDVIGALAAAMPDMAPNLLERLLQCTIVRPVNAPPTGPRMDIVQQLNEVEARREEYPETLALIKLLNALLAPMLANRINLLGCGVDLTIFTTFIQQHVLGHLWSRGYREARQKWEVAAAAFTHLKHVLQLTIRAPLPPPQPANEAVANPGSPPGYLILHDLLGGGPAYAALMHILLPGYAALTALQNQSDEVGPREAAVLAGLEVINAALQLDMAFVETLSQINLLNRYQPLHLKILSGGVRQLATLLQYVCYPDSADIQVEAINLTAALATRMPNIVEVLAEARPGLAGTQPVAGALPFISAAELGGTVGAAETAAALVATAVDLSDVLGSLRRGFAQAMAQGAEAPKILNDLEAEQERRRGPYGYIADLPDPRVAYVLRLLLQNSLPSLPIPSLAHLLLGYDMDLGLGGRLDESVLIPRQEYSCLTIVERILMKDEMCFAISKPKIFSQCLNLLHTMATAPIGGTPMTNYLNPKNTVLIPSLRGILNISLSSTYNMADGSELRTQHLGAGLHSRAWYMRITALLLLRLPDEDPARKLMAELLARPGEPAITNGAEALAQGGAAISGEAALAAAAAAVAGGRGFVPGSTTLLETMRSVSLLAIPEPQLSELSQEQRRMLQDLSTGDVALEQLLTNTALMAAAGIVLTSETGETLIYIPALTNLLQKRLDAFAARAGGAVGGVADAAADAVRAALHYASRYNAYMLLAGAQVAAVEAWQQLAQVVYTRQYELLNSMLHSTAAETLYETLSASLETVRGVMSRMDGAAERVAGPLCSAARVMLSKLQEQAMLHVSLGQTADPLAAVRVPARCQALLKLLVDLILRAQARRAPAVRLQLYAAALQYLQLSRGSKLATSCTPTVLTALLQGWGASAEAVAVLDQSEALIERANAVVISAHGAALVEALAADALSANIPALGQAVALHLLRGLLTVDSATGGTASAAVASATYRQNLPQQLLAQVAALPAATLAAGGKRARRTVHMQEAALTLLAGLATAGPPAARASAAQQLFSLNCVIAVNRCAALDLVPDDLASASLRGGLPFSSISTDSVRFRLNALTSPVLRLLLTVLAALPDSATVRGDVVGFASAHHQLLCRLMADAAGMETRTWAPGETELELADLALGLLVRLVPSLSSIQPPLVAEAFKSMAFKLALQFCCLEERSNSPIIHALRTWHRTGTMTSAGAAGNGIANGGVGAGAIVLPGSVAGARNVACSLGARVQSVRCSLARLLRDMAAAAASTALQTAGGTAAASTAMSTASSLPSGMMRAVGAPEKRELDPLTGRPTLLLVRDMAQQACHDAAAMLDELAELLALLRLPDAQLDEQTVTDRLLAYAPPGNATVKAALAIGSAGGMAPRRRLARHFWALAATSLDRQLSRALFVLEAALSTVAIHFLRYLPRPVSATSALMSNHMDTDELLDQASANLEMAAAVAAAPTKADGAALGSPEELQYLMTQLQDTCLRTEELLSRLAVASADMAGAAGRQQMLGGAGGWAVSGSPQDSLALSGQQSRHQPVEGIDLMVRALKMYCARS